MSISDLDHASKTLSAQFQGDHQGPHSDLVIPRVRSETRRQVRKPEIVRFPIRTIDCFLDQWYVYRLRASG